MMNIKGNCSPYILYTVSTTLCEGETHQSKRIYNVYRAVLHRLSSAALNTADLLQLMRWAASTASHTTDLH